MVSATWCEVLNIDFFDDFFFGSGEDNKLPAESSPFWQHLAPNPHLQLTSSKIFLVCVLWFNLLDKIRTQPNADVLGYILKQ